MSRSVIGARSLTVTALSALLAMIMAKAIQVSFSNGARSSWGRTKLKLHGIGNMGMPKNREWSVLAKMKRCFESNISLLPWRPSCCSCS